MEFETVIGLEIHAELSTKSKMFCSCPVTFGEEQNTCCCPVCMGLPGTLPVLNEKAVEYALRMGAATNCEVNLTSTLARKNYFYPDLPKGYQISQHDLPILKNGYIDINGKNIRIERIHVEEDAGKLIHNDNCTLVDYNRAGVPLIEIVTKPDLRSASEAKLFLERIKSILLTLEICHCKMQEGNLRCDVNVSVRKKGDTVYGQRCEMKNINSFSGAVRCIEYEEARQKKIVLSGGVVKRETRRWIDESGESELLRDKESAADYRFFTEPDLTNIIITPEKWEQIKKSIPEMPYERANRYVKDYKLPLQDAEIIVKHRSFTGLFEQAIDGGGKAKLVANWIMGDILKILNERDMQPEDIPFHGAMLAELSDLVCEEKISPSNAKAVVSKLFAENKSVCEIVKENNFTQIDGAEELSKVVKQVLLSNEKSVADYKNGKTNAFGYLMGKCMKITENRANAKILSSILQKELGK